VVFSRNHRDASLSVTSSAQPLEGAVSEGMRRGTVLWFDRDRGYGVIQTAVGGRNVVVHQTAVEQSGLIGLVRGQEVEFRLVPWGGLSHEGRQSPPHSGLRRVTRQRNRNHA
jgi:cold shock protein